MAIELPRDNNYVPMQSTSRSISSGSKNFTAGSAEILAASTQCRQVIITAKDTNAGFIFVGGSNVSASSKIGAPIVALQSVNININDLSLLYLDTTSSGDGVAYIYLV